MRQLPPFTRNSGVIPAHHKHKQYALGDRTVRFASALIWIVAALLIACSSDSTLPPPQVGNETSTDARPSVAATTTELPAVTPAAPKNLPTPAQPVPPSTALPALPTPTPTGTATVLRVTVSAVPATLPDYDRNDWKQWTDADRDCQDARNEVLIAESRTAVAYRTDRKCRVAAGEWLAPYTNTIVTDPGKLDVDHMVPLGNAHHSGAWQWSANQRERYANYLEDPQHLIAVTAGANRSKGARGPDQWKPEDRTYWCQYATDWITIKSTWELTVTQQEHTSLAQMLNTCAKRPELMVSQPEPSATDTKADQQSGTTDADAGDEDVQLLRRGTGGWRNPCTGEQRQWQRLPQVDGAQCQGRRWRRSGVREITTPTASGYNKNCRRPLRQFQKHHAGQRNSSVRTPGSP